MTSASSKNGAARKRLLRLLLISLMAAVTAVCAWITIPSPVPFTLQTFAVFLTLVLLGGKDGTLSVALYLAIGATGLPVFSGFKGGVGVLAGPTGGYLFGFLVIGFLYWLATALYKQDKKRHAVEPVALTCGMLLCYVFGTVWFLTATGGWKAGNGIGSALMLCVVPFLLPDGIKLFLAYLIGKRVSRILDRQNTGKPDDPGPSGPALP
ncbi:MAG: biotin transporter BioY [Clostridia bacterium]|nr:biotin transporter BioY [Clostridia bacterium]